MYNNSNIFPVYLIALGAFALGMASYVTAGLIPMISTTFTISIAVSAQLVTAFTLAYGLGSPVLVALLPANRQRFGLLLALIIFIIANICSALTHDFTLLLINRAIAGIGAGVYLAMGISASAAMSDPQNRGKSIAIIMGGMASGTVLGVPFSLILAEMYGWTSAFWLISILGIISFFGLLWKLPTLPSALESSLKQKLSLLVDKNVVNILLISLLAAIASLGMYTFIAPLMADPDYGNVQSITPYLWIWGVGGILGSILIGPIVDRFKSNMITLYIMIMLTMALILLPIFASIHAWFAMLPIALWGAVGWALQVPQNNELIKARENYGDGNLAVALNESALYLGSALGAALGGVLLLLHLPIWSLAISAGGISAIGIYVQMINIKMKRS